MPSVAVDNVPAHTAFIIKSRLFPPKASFQRYGRGKVSQKGLEIQFTKTMKEKNGEHILKSCADLHSQDLTLGWASRDPPA